MLFLIYHSQLKLFVLFVLFFIRYYKRRDLAENIKIMHSQNYTEIVKIISWNSLGKSLSNKPNSGELVKAKNLKHKYYTTFRETKNLNKFWSFRKNHPKYLKFEEKTTGLKNVKIKLKKLFFKNSLPKIHRHFKSDIILELFIKQWCNKNEIFDSFIFTFFQSIF